METYKIWLILLVALAIAIILFFVLREVNMWYWKINERIFQQHKTNFLLEKILIQLGATDVDEITIEDIASHRKRKIKIDKWIELKMNNSDTATYRTIKEESHPNFPSRVDNQPL